MVFPGLRGTINASQRRTLTYVLPLSILGWGSSGDSAASKHKKQQTACQGVHGEECVFPFYQQDSP